MTRTHQTELPLIDSHCHLDDVAFDIDRSALQRDARSVGIVAQIIPAITAVNWPRLAQINTEFPGTFAAYGLHPMYLDHHQPADLANLALWLQAHPEAVAIGECGLDFSPPDCEKTAQIDLFAAQLALAREHSLPVIIHARGAVEAVIDTIRSSQHHQGVVHSFNGSEVQARRLIDLGYRLGFGGAATFPRAKKLQRLISALPLDSLLLETDAPWQTPWQAESEPPSARNEPAWLASVFHRVCELRTESAEAIAQATTANARTLFALN